MDGVINVKKPAGWTSQDVCAKLRGRLHIKRIGHTGTLDPMATGVLPVCIGKATRIIEYYDRDRKAYHAVMRLGITTDTLDITGEVLETSDWSNVTEEAVREAFRAYTGVVSQVPPKYSALKINGKRAYELAREGKDFEIKAREIIIYRNGITRLALGAGEPGEIEFDVECSKGTYIRSMIADIGRSLGCGAVMTALERTASGYFRIEDAISIDDLVSIIDAEHNNEPVPARMSFDEILIPADRTLVNLGRILLRDNRVTAFRNGNSTHSNSCRVIEKSNFDNIYRVYARSQTHSATRANESRHAASPDMALDFLGIAAIIDGELVPQKVLI